MRKKIVVLLEFDGEWVLIFVDSKLLLINNVLVIGDFVVVGVGVMM